MPESGVQVQRRRTYEPAHQQEAGEVPCGWCGSVVMRRRAIPGTTGMCRDCLDLHHPGRAALRAFGVLAFLPALLVILALVFP